ncbi:HK97-gp10 family putative phage morphogenesis protein [Oceanobacillus oncorhynchi subsp. oncorhynchi]|uniref:HK97-gp10 family putative phage morphogenesis protein n=1 Tax=Oceanobacillus oncorhynchi TaxID=545501 RepID=UPI00362F1ECD
MARGSFGIKGTGPLIKAMQKKSDLSAVKKVVQLNTSELQRKMQRNATFTKGYSTGTTKRSITSSVSDNGFTGMVSPGTHYSPYLIYGTRFMASQDFFRPSFFEQRKQFISDMERIMG